MRTGRLGVLVSLVGLVTATLVVVGPAGSATGRPLPSYLSLDRHVKQLVTVTSRGWSSTHAQLRVWRKRDGRWRLVRGPVPASLGWSGWVPAHRRQQSTGTTPAGNFAMRYAFGNRRDPGTELRYRRVDGNDMWPYEPRDPATYNIYQPHRARGTQWRSEYVERLASYGYEYAYSVVLGYNLPRGVHWSKRRKQWVARRPADTSRGGGIFLHVKDQRYTAGCVSAPLRDVRWVVRWLDPALRPRIVMGPRAWVKRRF